MAGCGAGAGQRVRRRRKDGAGFCVCVVAFGWCCRLPPVSPPPPDRRGIEDCKAQCSAAPVCFGVEFGFGRCEVRTRPVRATATVGRVSGGGSSPGWAPQRRHSSARAARSPSGTRAARPSSSGAQRPIGSGAARALLWCHRIGSPEINTRSDIQKIIITNSETQKINNQSFRTHF